MNKKPFIFTGKPSRYGDIICFLPFITYLKKVYPDSYINFFIDKTCSSIGQFLLNYPGIDRMQISLNTDKVISEDYNLKYDLIFNLYNQLTNDQYYNFHSVQKENFIMSEVLVQNKFLKINPSEYDTLSKEEKFPKLIQYFDLERNQKTIAIWPFSGYGDSEMTRKRSPSLEWWEILVENLIKKGYKIIEFGHPNNRSLSSKNDKVINLKHLSLFDSIKLSMGCDLSITTDSGVSHILGAYGVNQICLYSPYQKNHYQNFEAMTPMNYKNNLLLFCGINNINQINQEHVLEKIQ